ncbi:putative Acetyltransferase [Vibrio nigripulchritudo SO65]|uniref:GNAT family N-acetyltransferase n=1 Tax=Vibrio nigripulchritudo TaxID=28173 RepID=UPI0003B21FF6|nr:GNAT family N-acetyltransferase [Vibrio nigripulchritudo]CCN36397.1 putative Acetyltransferase [Vibrio nigripulchritudo AM115]CCN40688.1 putative Acetyltransferase [Vibrio nigripulchritudo FTn2]CCN64505.1 putative Acetyltransferase [Vibrio nigripulchritudo POn4]CCN77388.1 putative Acetyltransferase [Vibrio nigripulchritudo SO65]
MKIVKLGWEQTIPVRHEVLWPDMPPDFCHVPGDEDALHYGVEVDGNIVCVASIFIDAVAKSARLRKFATLIEHRHQGYGSAVIEYVLTQLPEQGIEYFWCDARESAMDFYTKFGMSAEGDAFYKSGVEYYKMGRSL